MSTHAALAPGLAASLTLVGPTRWDQRDAWPQFGRGLSGGAWESYLSVHGMHCAGCALSVERALLAVPGVRAVQVQAATGVARMVWDPAAGGRPSQWLNALQEAGFDAVPATAEAAGAAAHRAHRVLLWRWLVAAFCGMQVMMYTAPVYLAAPGEIAPTELALLRWAAWLLTLPVLMFSCQPYFAAAWRDLRAGRVGMDVPVALGLAIAFAACTAGTFDPSGPWAREPWYDALTMFVFALLSARLVQDRMARRTATALAGLARELPQQAQRIGDGGRVETVPASRLVAGDRVLVRAGDAVPADGTVVQGQGQVHEAVLTGESRPLPKQVGDQVIAGSQSLDGVLHVQVERVGAQTQLAEIASLVARAAMYKPKLASLADRIAGPFLVAVLLAAGCAALWWWPRDPAQAVAVAVAVLIVTCPCALALATPTAHVAAVGALARAGILLRRPDALEAAAEVDCVMLDKTGTLTEDRLEPLGMQLRDGADPREVRALTAALGRQSSHPAARAVAELDPSHGWTVAEARESAGQGVMGVLTGPDGARRSVRLGSASFCGTRDEAAAGTRIHVADGQGWLASFDLQETLRANAARAVSQVRGLGLAVCLLSGDRPVAVQHVAQRCGIADARSHQTPGDKLGHLERLQQQGRRVAMVGDGINDAPVLARADLSVAVGQATPLASGTADVAVPGGDLAALPTLLRTARRCRAVVRQNLAWALAYNLMAVPWAASGHMPAWLAGVGMAASSLVVVLNAARLGRDATSN